MFGSYLQGFIGIAVAIVGSITMLAGVFDAIYFFVGLLMVFGGGYMKYLSAQTIRVGDDLTDAGLGQLNTRPVNEDNDVFEGSKDVLNDNYRFFLVQKYKIKRMKI